MSLSKQKEIVIDEFVEMEVNNVTTTPTTSAASNNVTNTTTPTISTNNTTLLNQQQIQYVTIQQIPQLVAVQVIPETQKSQESTSPIVLSKKNQQVMHFTQSIVQIAAAPVQTQALPSAPAAATSLEEKKATKKPKAIKTEPLSEITNDSQAKEKKSNRGVKPGTVRGSYKKKNKENDENVANNNQTVAL